MLTHTAMLGRCDEQWPGAAFFATVAKSAQRDRSAGTVLKKREGVVGASGFEPPASWSRTRRSSQAEPRPDNVVGRTTVYVGFAGSATCHE